MKKVCVRVTVFGVSERKGFERNDRHPLYELGRKTIILNAKCVSLSVSVCCVSVQCAIKHVFCMATGYHNCVYGQRPSSTDERNDPKRSLGHIYIYIQMCRRGIFVWERKCIVCIVRCVWERSGSGRKQ